MEHDLVRAPHDGNHTTFLVGPPGAGKTQLAVARLGHLLAVGVPAEQALVLVPQRTLAEPYYQVLYSTGSAAGGMVDIATIGGLARRTIELFWPLVAGPAGFGQPSRRPHFLTLETAQYYMDRVAEPFLAAGAFDGITIPRPRLISQVIDNLNKAAAVGFESDQIAARLKAAWAGESARLRIYDQVQALALAFRKACLAANLLDWSLQIEVFWHYLLPLPQLRRYLFGGYRHLIVDNTEEDIPATHDLLRVWLDLCQSALVVYDQGGGYRVFLGADPAGGERLAELCHHRVELAESRLASPDVQALGWGLAVGFHPAPELATPASMSPEANARRALDFEVRRFHPQMLDWVAEEISRLVIDEGVPAGEVAVLAPFLSDALRFALTERLDKFGIPVRTHRPSRELREEPAVRCLLTLAELAHPGWGRPPPAADVAHAFLLGIAGMDPVRARLLADIVYRVRDGQPALTPFYQIVPATQERISFLLGARYDELHTWLQNYIDGPGSIGDGEGLDHFLSRLFGEVLSQPGFGFHGDLDAGSVTANLIESIQKFRQAIPTEAASVLDEALAIEVMPGHAPDIDFRPPAKIETDLGQEYVDMVERGVIAAQYVSNWQVRPEDAVLLLPAYTFLMRNQPVAVQFWLDAGSRAWFERIYQPLTHPYVLRRDWPEGDAWADEHELRVREQALSRLIHGLALRCRRSIYLAFADLNERGYEQEGPLRQALQRLLRHTPPISEVSRG